MNDPKIDAAIEKLSVYGFDLIDDPDALKVMFDWDALPVPPLSVYVGGMTDGYDEPDEKNRFEVAPLVVQVRHEAGAVIHEHDPIEWLIEGSMSCAGEHVYCEITLARIRRAISAINSGLERLKAHEAKLSSLQP